MPELRLKFPVVLRRREDDLTLAVALGVPECSVADGNPDAAVASLEKQLVGFCEKLLPADLFSRLVRGDAKVHQLTLNLKSPNRNRMWRNEIACSLEIVQHRLDSGLNVAYVPALQLTAMTDNASELENLIRRQVIAALRRDRRLTLDGVAALTRERISIREIEFDVRLKSPKELLATERFSSSGVVQSLKKYAVQLRPDDLTSIEHRGEVVRQLAECLRDPFACSVLLVGPPGVGKTAVFKELARRHIELDFADKTFWMTEGSGIVAGATGFGMWQERCWQLIEGIRHHNGILHVGNLFELSEAGRINGSEGVAGLLSGPMRSGRLVAVAECTESQYTMLERQEPGITGCFERIVLEPPSEEQTRDILLKESVSIEARTKLSKDKTKPGGSLVSIDPGAIQTLDRLHRRFTSEVASPGRPLQWLRQWTDELHQEGNRSRVLDSHIVTERFSSTSGLPRFLIDPSVKPDLKVIADRLRNEVIGQDEVIDTLIGFIATLAADLQRPFRPLASLMLIGPTGVGKTETAKALARLMYNDASRLSRLDMSEFSTPGAVERLIGAAGCDGDGALTGAVRRQPFSVLLLDEIEKAHPSVFDILLQVLGEARLTDQRGRTASFANCIVLMTSNLGADTFRASSMGLTSEPTEHNYAAHFDRSVRNFFRPEFYNRIDRVLAYRPLPMEVVRSIARRRIEAIKCRAGLRERSINLQVDSEVINWIAKRGYQPQYGARPLVRAIERDLVIPISERVMGTQNKGTILQVDLDLEKNKTVEDGAERLKVTIASKPEAGNGYTQKDLELCRAVSKLRRMSQAMKRTAAYRTVEHEITQVERNISRQRLSAKQTSFQQQQLAQSLLEQQHLQKRLRNWNQLVDDLEMQEDRVLLAFYRSESSDLEDEARLLDGHRLKLWTSLLEMLQGSQRKPATYHLFILGLKLTPAIPLIRAYLEITKRWGATSAIKILRSSREILNDEWKKLVSEKPTYAFQERRNFELWSGNGEQSHSIFNGDTIDGNQESSAETSNRKSPTVVDAWSCSSNLSLENIPKDALGVMLSLSESSMCAFLRSEAGMHIIRPATHQDGKNDKRFLVELHEGAPERYQVPPKLVSRKLEPLGDMRRHYNFAAQQINDVVLNVEQLFGENLETTICGLVEKQLEILVWGQLE